MTAFFCYMMSRGREWNLYLLHSGSQIHFPCNKPARTHPQISCWIIFQDETVHKTTQSQQREHSVLHNVHAPSGKHPNLTKRKIPRWRSPPRKNTRYITWQSGKISAFSLDHAHKTVWPTTRFQPTEARSAGSAPHAVPHGRPRVLQRIWAPPARSWPCPWHTGKPRRRLHRLWQLRWYLVW